MTESELHATLGKACAAAGFDSTNARLIHHSSNAVFVLPTHQAVVRISTGAADLSRAMRAHALTEHLSCHGFGTTTPFPGTAPIVVHDHDVSFWTYYPQPPNASPPTSRELGSLLRQLHSFSPPHDIHLPRWIPLESLHTALTDPNTESGHLSPAERHQLLGMVDEIRHQIADITWPLGHGLLHGDAWAGNLLWSYHGNTLQPILGDWDWASVGPLEVDLIPTWHASIRYGRDRQWVETFITEYGYDLAEFAHGFEVLRRMRDLVQISGPLRREATSPEHATRLRQRVEAILAGDTDSTWHHYGSV